MSVLQEGQAAIAESIRLNYEDVCSDMAKAVAKSPFQNQQVQLVAVTKTVATETIQQLVACGVGDLGENKVQEILAKKPELPPDLRWHLIGHLQTNKVRHIINQVALIHSLDRLELVKEIEKRAQAHQLVVPCLIQVNIAEEDSKFGLPQGEVWDFCQELKQYPHIAVRGLMTVGPFLDQAHKEEIRPVFAALRQLRDTLLAKAESKGLAYLNLQELSMGMSNDFDIAIEEGATMVRVGSKLFGSRVYR